MARYVICPTEELPPGAVKIVEVERRSIGIFNVHGTYYALRNRCPHRGAPLCQGSIKGLVTSDSPYQYNVEREGEIVRCPWHGWEFDITNGRTVFNPHRVYVRSYPVAIEDSGCVEQDGDEDPSIETFPVNVERQMIVLYTRPTTNTAESTAGVSRSTATDH